MPPFRNNQFNITKSPLEFLLVTGEKFIKCLSQAWILIDDTCYHLLIITRRAARNDQPISLRIKCGISAFCDNPPIIIIAVIIITAIIVIVIIIMKQGKINPSV